LGLLHDGAIDFRQIVNQRSQMPVLPKIDSRSTSLDIVRPRWSFGRSRPRAKVEPSRWTMPASTTSAFSNAGELEAALRNMGDVRLVVTGRGEFRVRLTHVELQRLRLWAVDERASRIGFLKVPPDVLLALFTIGDQPSPVWSGTSLDQGEILTRGPNHRLHMWTEGPSCWGAVSLPVDEFRAYFSQLTGQVLAMPIHAQRWRPAAAACKRFMQLHTAAIRAAGMRPQTIADPEAAHGMEQQLIHSLVGCLSAGPGEDASDPQRCQDVVADLEDLLQSQPERYADLTALRAALGVSDGHLRRCCKQILGIGPAAYVHLNLSDRARRASRGGAVPGIAMQS
jgi:AraC-like DNA-binding protein